MHPLAVEFTATWSSNATLPPRPSYPQERTFTPRGPACPSWAARWSALPPQGLCVLLPYPSIKRVAATAPVKPDGACVALFPSDVSLSRFSAGSTSTLPVSRTARCSLTLRPACSLNRLTAAILLGVLQPKLLPTQAAAPIASGRSSNSLPGGMICIRWVYDAFPRSTEKYRLTRSI